MIDISSVFLFIGLLILLILNIVLFFKVWGMTSNVKGIHKLIFIKESLNIESNDILEKSRKETVLVQLRRHV
jgi:hypothetical protein